MCSHIITSRLLRCVRVLTDGLLRQNGREHRSRSARQILLPASAGALSQLTEALALHIIAFLGVFERAPLDAPAAARVHTDAAVVPRSVSACGSVDASEDESDDRSDDAGPSTAATRRPVGSWRLFVSSVSIPQGLRPLACSCESLHYLLQRHAIAVYQNWRD